MPPEFRTAEIPETPRYWAELERQMLDASQVAVVSLADAPATPERHYREPRFPLAAVAAMVAIATCTAFLLQWLPGHPSQADVAEPGTERPPMVLSIFEPTPIDLIPFERASERASSAMLPVLTELDRLTSNLRNHGYEVHIAYQTVTDPSLDGEILHIRHAFDTTRNALLRREARGPVIVTVAEVPPDSRIF